MNRIFKLTQKAMREEMDWDLAIANSEIETVEEFETVEDAEKAFNNGGYDTDFYGIE